MQYCICPKSFQAKLFLTPLIFRPRVRAPDRSPRARPIFPLPAGGGGVGKEGETMRIEWMIGARMARDDSAEARGARLQLRRGSSTASSVSA